jgi:hypothetical protein
VARAREHAARDTLPSATITSLADVRAEDLIVFWTMKASTPKPQLRAAIPERYRLTAPGRADAARPKRSLKR